jgi:hypothetical protein
MRATAVLLFMQGARASDTPNAFASISSILGGASDCGALHHAFFVSWGGVGIMCGATAHQVASSIYRTQGLQWSAPANFTGTSTISAICAATCNALPQATAPKPPRPPPQPPRPPPPTPLRCGESRGNFDGYRLIDLRNITINATILARPPGGVWAAPRSADFDRTRLHVLATPQRCVLFCALAPDFYTQTGVRLTVHCVHNWAASLAYAQQSCLCNTERAAYSGNYYLGPAPSGGTPPWDEIAPSGVMGGFDVMDVVGQGLRPKHAIAGRVRHTSRHC